MGFTIPVWNEIRSIFHRVFPEIFFFNIFFSFPFSLWMTGFQNFNCGMQSPISIRVHPTCTQDPKDLTVAGDLRRKSHFSLSVLRRIVRFTNTGFWISMKGSHDSFERLWKNCTRVLLLHQFGHFLYTCYEYQFTNVFLVLSCD